MTEPSKEIDLGLPDPEPGNYAQLEDGIVCIRRADHSLVVAMSLEAFQWFRRQGPAEKKP